MCSEQGANNDWKMRTSVSKPSVCVNDVKYRAIISERLLACRCIGTFLTGVLIATIAAAGSLCKAVGSVTRRLLSAARSLLAHCITASNCITIRGPIAYN